jgi:hypothetical protein
MFVDWSGPDPSTLGLANEVVLEARAMLDSGDNEGALRALEGEIQQGAPWWLLQARDLAAGRLAKRLDEAEVAIARLTRSLGIPTNGGADADLVLDALMELSEIDATNAPGAVTSSEWAGLARRFAARSAWALSGERLRMLTTRGQTLSWRPYIADASRMVVTLDDWEAELDQLEESLYDLVATAEWNPRLAENPYSNELATLRSGNPTVVHAAVSDVLIESYFRSGSRPLEPEKKPDSEPWWTDAFAVPRIEAILSKACAAMGDVDGAERAHRRAMAGFVEANGWVLQLDSLLAGRVEVARGAKDAAFDNFWEAICRGNAIGCDLDLVFETLAELAELGDLSAAHPPARRWAAVALSMVNSGYTGGSLDEIEKLSEIAHAT